MKLSQEESSKLIIKACEHVVDSKNTLRFGQALWNLLPKNVADVHHSSVNDFFYWKDDGKVLYTFFKHYVVSGGIVVADILYRNEQAAENHADVYREAEYHYTVSVKREEVR